MPRDLATIITDRLVRYFRLSTERALYYSPSSDRFLIDRVDRWSEDDYRLLTSRDAVDIYRRCGSDPWKTAAFIRTRCVLSFPDVFEDSRAIDAHEIPNSAWLDAQERRDADRYIQRARTTQATVTRLFRTIPPDPGD